MLRRLTGWAAWAAIFCTYGASLVALALLPRPRRPRRKEADRDDLRLLITGRFDSQNWCRAHLTPLARAANVNEIVAAAAAGASFVTFGPVFDTPSKRGMGQPVGCAALAAAVHRSPLPIFALGGIGPTQVAAVRASGCHGVAAISALLGGEDPGPRTAAMIAALNPDPDTCQSL